MLDTIVQSASIILVPNGSVRAGSAMEGAMAIVQAKCRTRMIHHRQTG